MRSSPAAGSGWVMASERIEIIMGPRSSAASIREIPRMSPVASMCAPMRVKMSRESESLCSCTDPTRTPDCAAAPDSSPAKVAPAEFGVPTHALLDLPIESYDPADCPQCAAGRALSEPGSRFLSAK